MAFDGSGTYSLLYTWATEAASPPIAISKLDSEFAGIATGLSSCLVRSVNSTMTGSLTITSASGLNISAAVPYLFLTDTNAATDETKWGFDVDAGDLRIVAWNDAVNSGSVPIKITRTGTTSDLIALTATSVTVNTNEVATITSGSFTMELASDTSGGSVYTSGTAYWKKVGNVVTLRMPNLYTTTTDTSLYLRGIPAAIQPSLTGTYTQSIMVGGYVDGSAAMVEIRIAEGVAYWGLNALAGFASSNTQKGVGFTTNVGPTITYQTAD